jgi:glycosyltransferase involved in cell wall biosynthesis
MSPRVALVTEVIAPYRVPVFNELAALLDGGLHVIFIAETEARRDWPILRDQMRFGYEVLGGLQFSVPLRGDTQPVYLATPVSRRLDRGHFDAVVVGGWNHLECYWALAWAKRRRRRFVLWSETPLLGPFPSRPARNALKRAVVRGADAYIVPGPSAGRYLDGLGAPPAAIHVAPNAVDVDFWSTCSEGAQRGPGITLLYSGRLVRSKGVDVALAAFAASRLATSAELVIAGDGPERARLESSAPPGVRFVGPQEPEALRRLYHSSDLLVFPSLYDPWGLVLNEAACAGLAAAASDAAGATRDLIRDGENGLVVPAGDVDALRAVFDRMADDPGLASRLGFAATAIRETHSPRRCAEGMAEAVR